MLRKSRDCRGASENRARCERELNDDRRAVHEKIANKHKPREVVRTEGFETTRCDLDASSNCNQVLRCCCGCNNAMDLGDKVSKVEIR